MTQQKSDIEQLSMENVEQGTQLAQHQFDIVRFTQSHYIEVAQGGVSITAIHN